MKNTTRVVAGVITLILLIGVGLWFSVKNSTQNEVNNTENETVFANTNIVGLTDVFVEKKKEETEVTDQKPLEGEEAVEEKEVSSDVYIQTVGERLTQCFYYIDEDADEDASQTDDADGNEKGKKDKNSATAKTDDNFEENEEGRLYIQFYELQGILLLESEKKGGVLGFINFSEPDVLNDRPEGGFSLEGTIYFQENHGKKGENGDVTPVREVKNVSISMDEEDNLSIAVEGRKKSKAVRALDRENIHTDESILVNYLDSSETVPQEWIGCWTQKTEEAKGHSIRNTVWIGSQNFIRLMTVSDVDMPVVYVGAYGIDEGDPSMMHCVVEKIGFGTTLKRINLRISLVNGKLNITSEQVGDMILDSTRW